MSRAIVWFRRDLRLDDHPALQAALKAGHAPVPVYIHAPEEEAPWAPGAASHVWLDRSLRTLQADLRALGSDLIIRRGPSTATLLALAKECEAEAIHWHRLYEPASIARDSATKAALKAAGLQAESHNGALLAEPWTVKTGSGDPYRVFTPFWKNARQALEGNTVLPAPKALPSVPPIDSLAIDALGLRPPAREGGWDLGFWTHWTPGEAGAGELLEAFIEARCTATRSNAIFPTEPAPRNSRRTCTSARSRHDASSRPCRRRASRRNHSRTSTTISRNWAGGNSATTCCSISRTPATRT